MFFNTRLNQLLLALFVTFFVSSSFAMVEMREDKVHVRTWNTFADSLYKLHLHYMSVYKNEIKTKKKVGGYVNQPNFYVEVSYYHKKTNRLLSRIQWEKKKPNQIHVIEVFVYDKQGRVIRDYLAAFLPRFRNAPIQTLINVHSYDGKLHSFRQFDASGYRIYEHCKGEHSDKNVDISLFEDDLFGAQRSEVIHTAAYKACFAETTVSAKPYLNPLNEINGDLSIRPQDKVRLTEAD